MHTLISDNKKYVVIEKEKFDKIQLLAEQKFKPIKIFTLEGGKKHSYK